MQTKETQQAEILAAAPWLDTPCLNYVWARYANGTEKDHRACCQGTGKLESWAWTQCESPECKLDNHMLMIGPGCDGSGLVLDVTLEKVLDELEAAGYNDQEFFSDGNVSQKGYVLILEFEREGTGPTRLAAALSALRQVKEVTDA